jgi:two-component system, LuxR family, response regulator FixJ
MMENAGGRVVHLVFSDDAERGRLLQMLRTEGYEVQAHESAPRFLEAVGPESRGCVVADEPSTNHEEEREERIRKTAYFIWLEEGCPEGQADRHWQEAQKIVEHVRVANMTSLELLARMKAGRLNLPVIVCADQGEVGLAIQAIKEGAVGFIEKPLTEGALLRAVGAALARVDEPADRDRERDRHLEALATLTQQERVVFGALIRGKTDETIAYELGLSVKTVAAHHAKLMAKTKARSLSDLVRLAVHAIPIDNCA